MSNAGTLTYGIQCTGNGTTNLINTTVTVNPAPKGTHVPTVTLSANPMTVTVGQPVTLTWSSKNATQCFITSANDAPDPNNSLSANGTKSVTSAGYGWEQYNVTCTGSGGVGSAGVRVVGNP
jgi:hypothetical protein